MKSNERYYKVISWLFALTIIVWGICSFCPNFFCRNKEKSQIYKDALLSIVEVKAVTESVGESFGTAEFVGDGKLITNAHVVTYKKLGETFAFDNIYIRFASETDYHAVEIVKYDTDKDLAVLKSTDVSHDTLEIDRECDYKTGDEVYAIGNLNNIGISFTEGVISNKKINVEHNAYTREVIQCDLTIAEGNSGGALLNKQGQLIGITTFRLRDTSNNVIYGISYCIPANVVWEYISN